MSRGQSPTPGYSRLSIFGSLAVLVAVIAGFAWVAVKSYELLHSELTTSKLKPVKITGPEEILFDWSKDACEPRDIPDEPAHAFRDDRGEVHLIASHYVTRQATGPSLNAARHRCRVVMRSAYDRQPQKFSYKEWMFSPYTVDGRNVFALIHNEYHGSEIAGECPSGSFFRCWYTGVTLARSRDSGATFTHARKPPDHLVAEVPYPYTPDSVRAGIVQPSNIVKKEGFYYALVAATRYGVQENGACLIRTDRLSDPKSWRAWDGEGFSIQFIDPYGVTARPADHVCEPVSREQIGDMTGSLTFNTYFDKYLLVGTSVNYDPAKRRMVRGFYYSLSDDLIEWSERRLIKEAVLIQNYECGGPDPLYYASLLDPASESPNFETSGQRAYLYYTRFHYEACRLTFDRDLVRVPVEFSK